LTRYEGKVVICHRTNGAAAKDCQTVGANSAKHNPKKVSYW